jgi:microcystin-dependent protein
LTVYFTQNLGLPFPDGNEQVLLGPQDFQNIVQILDGGGTGPTAMRHVAGALGGRPSAATYPLGTLYQATDISGVFLRDASSNWRYLELDGGNPPIGSSADYYGTTDVIDPDGVTRWVIQDGRNTLSRTTYSTLFARIGTTYGAGDGSTTFGIPDTRGRVTLGAGSGPGLTSRALGSKGGAETVSADLAQHRHSTYIEDNGHGHNVTGFSSSNPASAGPTEGDTAQWYFPGSLGYAVPLYAGVVTALAQAASTGIYPYASDSGSPYVTNYTGTGGGHANIQPFVAANKIIRII